MGTVLNWMKQFLILYLILTILTQLAAAEAYKKYLRFLSGIILMLVLVSPLLRLFGSEGFGSVLQSYDRFWDSMDSFSIEAANIEQMQEKRRMEKYEQAAASDLIAFAKAQGIAVNRASVSLNEDYTVNSVAVWLEARQKQLDPAARDRMAALLRQAYQLQEHQIFIDEGGE